MKKFDRSLLPAAPDLRFEQELWSQGLTRVVGVDEAGRGALAGPVAAAAVLLPVAPSLVHTLAGVRDSKVMTAAQREHWAGELRRVARSWSVGFASSQEIDLLGIVPATCLAMQRALDGLQLAPQHLLVDYIELPDCGVPQTPLVKGDARSLSIAAASVLAKTARDARLHQLDAVYPGYGLAAHKGYGTRSHCQAIERLGPSPVHRRTFAPIRRGCEEQGDSKGA